MGLEGLLASQTLACSQRPTLHTCSTPTYSATKTSTWTKRGGLQNGIAWFTSWLPWGWKKTSSQLTIYYVCESKRHLGTFGTTQQPTLERSTLVSRLTLAPKLVWLNPDLARTPWLVTRMPTEKQRNHIELRAGSYTVGLVWVSWTWNIFNIYVLHFAQSDNIWNVTRLCQTSRLLTVWVFIDTCVMSLVLLKIENDVKKTP